MNVSEQVAEYVGNVKYEDLSQENIDRMKLQIVDSIGVMAAGVHGTSVAGVVELIRSFGAKEEATALFQNLKAPAHLAAFINSLQMSAFDYAMITAEAPGKTTKPHHASETDVSVAMTVSDALNVSGKDMMCALAIGNDVAARLAFTTGTSYFGGKTGNRGTLNTMSATTIAARLYGLSAKETMDALGLALMASGGSSDDIGNNSTLTKFPVGLAARTGIFSAQIAKKGFYGLLDPLCGKAGYYGLFGGENDRVDLLTEDLGKVFYSDCEIKPWPGCAGTHKINACAMRLKKAYDIDPAKITKIVIEQPPNVKLVGKKLQEDWGEKVLNALFNVRFSDAVLLAKGELNPYYYTEEYFSDPEILRLHDMTEVIYRDGTTTLTVYMEDGSVYTESTDYAYGELLHDPMPYDEIIDKFFVNCEYNGTIDKARAQEIVDVCKDIELIEHTDELFKLLY